MIQTTSILDLEAAKGWLRGQLSPERFEHSLGAHEKAVELAEKFRLSQDERERAAVAGLLHDAAKLMSPSDLLEACDHRFHLQTDEMDRRTPQTLHPFVGAELVREAFSLHDEDVLNAIRFHTTGRGDMSTVEKIVYIADKIEGNTRNPLYIQRVTASLDFKNLWSVDLTMLYILDSTIEFLMSKHQLIHPRTIAARNHFVETLRAEGHL